MTLRRSKFAVGILIAGAIVFAVILSSRRVELVARIPVMESPLTRPVSEKDRVASGGIGSRQLVDESRTQHDRFEEEGARLNTLPVDDGVRVKALIELVNRWMAVAPRDCMVFINGLEFDWLRIALSHRAMGFWLASDLVSARTYAEEKINEDDKNSAYYLVPVLEQILKNETDIGEVFRFVSRLPQTEVMYIEVMGPFVFCLQRDFSRSLAFAQSCPPNAKASFLTFAGLEEASQRGPALLSELSGSGARTDLAPQQITGIISGLFGTAPAETLRWLEMQPASPDFDAGRSSVAQRLNQGDPKAAVGIASMITDIKMRNLILMQIFPGWAAKDYAAAETWSIASELPVEEVARSLFDAQKLPVPFAERMAAIPVSNDAKSRMRAQAIFYAQWSQSDSSGAATWLAHSDLSPEDKKRWATILR